MTLRQKLGWLAAAGAVLMFSLAAYTCLNGCAHSGPGYWIPPLKKDCGVTEYDDCDASDEAAVPPSPACTTWYTCNAPDSSAIDAGNANSYGCNGIGCNTPGSGGTPGPGSGHGMNDDEYEFYLAWLALVSSGQ